MTAPSVTLGFFKLVVKDFEGMLDFYERAFGFTVARKIESPVMEEAILTLPGADGRFSMVLYHWKDGRVITVGNGHGPVGLNTKDVDGAYAHAIAQGASSMVEPFAFPGARIAFVLDPEGHEIELIGWEAAA